MIINLDGEVWVPVFRCYEVSNMGRVKSYKGRKPRILKPGNNYAGSRGGYLYVIISINGRKINWPIHRLVALIFVNNINPLRVTVNHHNGTLDNRAVSLSWMTQSENSRHGVENGLLKRGSKHHNAILDETQIKVIKSLKGQIRGNKIAKYFRICSSNVSMIMKGKRWGQVAA